MSVPRTPEQTGATGANTADVPAALSLHERVVLITGGGSGLGAAIARDLLAAGARVALADIDRLRTISLLETLDPGAQRSCSIACDVGRSEDCTEAVAQTLKRFGTLDVVVNNAGTDVTEPLASLSVTDWNRVLATNLSGPFLLSKAALRALLAGYDGAGGQIVNIASTASRRAWANASAYHASKWGLLGLTQALHAELRAQGVRVTALLAGGMRTPFLLDRFKDIDPSVLQDPATVALAVRFALELPRGSVIPELMVLPEHETSWP